LKKKNSARLFVTNPPGRVSNDILRSRTTLFASFSGKRRILLRQLIVLPRVGYQATFCEAEQCFLLLFLEKEEYHEVN
jgi:hypothetical protein